MLKLGKGFEIECFHMKYFRYVQTQKIQRLIRENDYLIDREEAKEKMVTFTLFTVTHPR